MIAVIFEVEVAGPERDEYLDTAGRLRSALAGIDGFISVERFQSLSHPDRMLSLSFWRDEDAVRQWRNLAEHRQAQALGRARVFRDYRLRIAEVARDYGMTARDQAPADSRAVHPPG